MPKEYSDQDYYWEKAEFQDPVSHRRHVENYKNGIRSSIAFDEQYMKEAMEENYILDPCWQIRADGSLQLLEVSIIPNPMFFDEPNFDEFVERSLQEKYGE